VTLNDINVCEWRGILEANWLKYLEDLAMMACNVDQGVVIHEKI
jgi:hypothetical protein